MNIIMKIGDLFRPVLADRTILKYNKQGLLLDDDLRAAQIQPNSIDLSLANSWAKPLPNDKLKDGTPVLNPKKPVHYNEGKFYSIELADGSIIDSGYVLKPNEFVLMASKEKLRIPNGILSFVQGRSSIARIGLQTEQAGLIDAGFEGTITFEVQNETPDNIILIEGMRVGQLYFFKAEHAAKVYGSLGKGSKYQGQIFAKGSEIHRDPELR